MDTCGAKTRAGTPCRQKSIYRNGRCKFHGGLATGPTTEAGKEQSRINGRKGGRPRRDAVGKTEVMDTEKTGVSAQFAGEDLGRIAEPEMSNPVHVSPLPDQPESSPGKPKSWMLKDANVLLTCERCTRFAGSGACLAVAKGIIPSMPSSGNCPGFIDFGAA